MAAVLAVADFTDLRSPSRAGHSRGVAHLAATAAGLCGLPAREIVTLRRAALVHDVGMHGVPASILDKTGPLTGTEAERMRLHSYWTERALARPAALARVGAIASLACERLDGSGYHRGVSGAAIPATGRILAAADACHAMSEPRPHRPALSLRQAADELRREVRLGRLAADAVDAVLAAAGQQPAKRRAGPAGSPPARSRSSPSSPAAHPPGRSPTPLASPPRQRRLTSSASTPRSGPRPAPPPRCSPCSTACWTASARSICRENPRRQPGAGTPSVLLTGPTWARA